MTTRSAASRRLWMGGLLVGVLLQAGCSAGEVDGRGKAESTTEVTPTGASAAPTDGPRHGGEDAWEDAVFTYKQPNPACPPLSALTGLPLVDGSPYEEDPFVYEHEGPDYILAACSYMPAGASREDERVVVGEHVIITSEFQLRTGPDEVRGPGATRQLPLWTEDLQEWDRAVLGTGGPRVWREGCGDPPMECDGGAEPDVTLYRDQFTLAGYVGNLVAYVTLTYVAQQVPDHAVDTGVRLIRDLVFAAVENFERVD